MTLVGLRGFETELDNPNAPTDNADRFLRAAGYSQATIDIFNNQTDSLSSLIEEACPLSRC